MNRIERIRELHDRLGGRRIVWFGTRGADAQPLLVFEEFGDCCSQIAPLGAVSIRRESCLETMRRRRVDLDTYDIDQDHSESVEELQDHLLDALRRPAVVVPYRPSRVLSSVCFLCSRTAIHLGQFADAQLAFEHKHWVESGLRTFDVPVVPWVYLAPTELRSARERLDGGPVVIRRARSCGGVGYMVARETEDLAEAARVMAAEDVVAVAPLLDPTVPLNVGGCVFSDGSVRAYSPSLQLIGIAGCTRRGFGYCGNDFGAIRGLGRATLQRFDTLIQAAGAWLHRTGYRGAFGVDALLYEDDVLLMEINPRFQGSSVLSAEITAAMDLPDIYLDHMAAHLDLRPSDRVPVQDWAEQQPARAQIICHNTAAGPLARARRPIPDVGARFDMVPAPDVAVEPDAALFKVIVEGAVTADGFHLNDQGRTQVAQGLRALFSNSDSGGDNSARLQSSAWT